MVGICAEHESIHHPKMKHKTTPLHKRSRPYLKWLLWLSLSLYFFTSYQPNCKSPTNSHLISLSNPNFLSTSKALLESSLNTSQPNLPLKLHNLKIYIYDLPSHFNTAWLANLRCNTHLFAAEVALHEALSSSEFRTFDPYHADFFLVPVYVSCNFSTVNGFPAIGHARPLLASAVQRISSEMLFWNRSNGADHVFVATHDFGACFHTMENVAIADGIPGFLKNSIILQTFGVRTPHPCQDVENVMIPPYVSPESLRSTLKKAPESGKRDIWVFFRGKMEVHPKNVSGHFYGNQVRTKIWHKFNQNKKFYIKRKRYAGYQSEIVRSVFCLCPLGWAPWSPRLVESVVLGCIPVIIADNIRLPFASAVPWPKISLTIAENDVNKLETILDHVAATNLSIIQHNLWDPTVRRSLLFNREIQYGDATWQVLEALSQKFHKSIRRRSIGQQVSTTWR